MFIVIYISRGIAKNRERSKNGTPYIIHPLSMACDAIACKGTTDEIVATILLHDVCEDCNIPLSALPVNEVVKNSSPLLRGLLLSVNIQLGVRNVDFVFF